jgi:hypothetical protein
MSDPLLLGPVHFARSLMRMCRRRALAEIPRGHESLFALLNVSSRSSPSWSGRSSPNPSGADSAIEPVWPMPAPFTGFEICRHLYTSSRWLQLSLPESGGEVPPPLAPRTRRPRYRLRAGSTAPLLELRTVGRPRGGVLMPARRRGCQQRRRGRGCARSARVVAVERERADLDRLVAALLALASAPKEPKR